MDLLKIFPGSYIFSHLFKGNVMFIFGNVVEYFLTATIKDALTTKNDIGLEYRGDSSEWMTDHFNLLKNRALYQITLPGCHDAGGYEIPDSMGTNVISKNDFVTQSMRVYDQLNGGMRYFDLRPTYQDGRHRIYHGQTESLLLGPDFFEVIGDVKRFLTEKRRKKELIILSIFHMDNYDDTLKFDLMKKIKNELSDFMFTATGETEMTVLDYPFHELLRNGSASDFRSRVLIRIDGTDALDTPGYDPKTDARGFFFNDTNPSIAIFDEYSETLDLKTMFDDQMDKLENIKKYPNRSPYGNENELFLLSWTLTHRPDLKTVSSQSIKQLASEANDNLPKAMKKLFYDEATESYHPEQTNKINIIYVDYFELSHALEFALILNYDVFPTNPKELKDIEAKVLNLRFYLPIENIPRSNRQYRGRFKTSELYTIGIELNLNYPNETTIDRTLKFEYVIDGPDGKEFQRLPWEASVNEGWSYSWHDYIWGYSSPFQWAKGMYRVKVLINGELAIQSKFFVD